MTALCILKNEWLYNLGGGYGSEWSVGKLALTGSGMANHNKWEEIKLRNNHSFIGFRRYGVEVIGLIELCSLVIKLPSLWKKTQSKNTLFA